jgi:hypothetical protein
MVISSVGALGYAPAMIARQMIAAVQRTGGTLKGFVISVGNSQKTVEVELTLS